MKLSIKDFFSKCDQIRNFLWWLFLEKHDFRSVSGELLITLPKLCISTIYSYQKFW